ncbi:unnamed protein product [Thlaspi arvense]|uniref:Bromo domain-containing protein n=1 Tax=Thlaspi arvense TaxID=13288 RepID=A0AAU9S403_THLAR|nr:unnamed protein product [Thlaspi arvense]
MTKEEEAGSYSMNDDTNNIINNDYICSDDFNNRNIGEEDDNTNPKHNSQAWGTWEELLLACAVKRHGFADWDSVASEVRSRSSISGFLASANNCRQKYRDLKRRFQESSGGESDAAETVAEDGGKIPWLEQLRSLRMAELRREVQQYDVSILSLQLKVKKLEEERDGDEKPDLEDERKGERSGNDGSESEHREKAEESERENRSMNESNSTASGGKTAGEDERVGGDEPSRARDDSISNNPDPDPVCKAEEGSEASHSGELGESGTSGSEWKRKRRKHGDGSKSNHDSGAGEIRSAASKSQPLIGLLDLIRSHPRGSLFERRLRSQETKDYKSLVKQHLDIETIQRKLKQGSYESSSLILYRDLQLLFTNAIVFFPSSSPESMAAHELRTVVYEEMRKETGKSGPRLINQEASAVRSIKADAETSESSLSRQKSSGPLVVCKKRSVVSAKASPSSSSLSQKEETKEEILSEEKENTGTVVRSSRRANKVVASAAVIANNTKTGKGKNTQKQTESKTNSSNDNTNNGSEQKTGKTEKKTISSDKKKSVADFLKRLKKNSPQKEGKEQNKSGGNGKKESKSKPRELRSNNVGKKKKAEVEITPVKRAPGRPQKKPVEAVATTAAASASGKRGRESGSTGKDNKQPRKRTRR